MAKNICPARRGCVALHTLAKPMFNKIEPEARAYLKKVFVTLAVGLLWMFANVVAGLGYGLALIEGKLSTTNIIFYAWLLLSLIALLLFFVKMWRRR